MKRLTGFAHGRWGRAVLVAESDPMTLELLAQTLAQTQAQAPACHALRSRSSKVAL
jgi:hypothetical protein